MSFFLYLAFSAFVCVFSFFLFSCFFYFWKTPLTSYPFNLIRLLTLEPFILCSILLYLRIQCICHGLFLRAKIDFTICKGELIQVQSFKYLGINIPSTNRWNMCYKSSDQAGLNSYYMFENQCSQSDT